MKTIAITRHEGVVALLVKKGYLSEDPGVRKEQVHESWSTLSVEDTATAHLIFDTLSVALPFWVAADCGRVTEMVYEIPDKEKANAPTITEKRATDWLVRMDSYDVRRL